MKITDYANKLMDLPRPKRQEVLDLIKEIYNKGRSDNRKIYTRKVDKILLNKV